MVAQHSSATMGDVYRAVSTVFAGNSLTAVFTKGPRPAAGEVSGVVSDVPVGRGSTFALGAHPVDVDTAVVGGTFISNHDLAAHRTVMLVIVNRATHLSAG